MKKILLFFVLFLGFFQWAFADNFIYTSGSPNGACYIKSDGDNSQGTLVISSNCNSPTLSPDGLSLVYQNSSDTKCYKRLLSDSGNGSAITSGTCQNPSYSPDGLHITYRNTYIYVKSSLDSLNGDLVTTNQGTTPSFSPDGLTILYKNSSDNYCYIKPAFSLSSGSAVNSVYCANPSFSPDGLKFIYSNFSDSGLRLFEKTLSITGNGIAKNNTYSEEPYYSSDGLSIVYRNAGGGNLIYKKSSSDSLDGSSITTSAGYNPSYKSASPETCSDLIKNQDETGIDVGGICGNNTFKYTGTGAVGTNVSCSTVTLTSATGTFNWYTDYGTLTPSAYISTVGTFDFGTLSFGWDDTGDNGNSRDLFRGLRFGLGSYVPHELMTYKSGLTGSVLNSDAPYGQEPILRVGTKRNGQYRPFNVIQASYDQSFIQSGSILPTWGGLKYGKIGDAINGNVVIADNGPVNGCTRSGTGNCMIFFNKIGTVADIFPVGGLTGIRIGLSSTTTGINKVSCSNSSYSCNWKNTVGGYQCLATIDRWYVGNNVCSVTSEGYCAPTSALKPINPDIEKPVLDGSGNVIGIEPIQENENLVDDIFTCQNYADWTDIPACIIQIVKNGYNVTKNTIKSSTGDGENTIVGTVKQIGSSGGTSIDFGPVSPTGVNFADNVFRGVWNKSFDNNEPLTRFGRMALFMSLMLVFLATVLVITFIGVRKK